MTGSAGSDKINVVAAKTEVQFVVAIVVFFFFFLFKPESVRFGYLVASWLTPSLVRRWYTDQAPDRHRGESVPEPLRRQPETRPGAFSALHAKFWVINIRDIRKGSYLANDVKICNKK